MKINKLNNKGFTLIELLAVVVILAVVMGIAMTSVLSSMNKARGGSLSDTASVIYNGFTQKYTESLVDGVPTNVYNDVTGFGGYNFTVDSMYYLDEKLASEFNISGEAYMLKAGATANVIVSNTEKQTSVTDIENSFVAFDADYGKYLVCMVANKTGNVFVSGYAIGGANDNDTTSVTFDGVTYSFKTGEMFSCSEGTSSWGK